MAVRHGYGKIAGADALVFAYDTGDTRNSYKGEPTVNHINGGGNRANAITNPFLGSHGASVTTETISDGNRKDVFRIYSTNTSGYYMVNQHSSILNTSGNTYTYSFEYKKIRGTSNSFSPSAIYKNGYKSPDSGTAASNLQDTYTDLGDGWTRLSRTYTSTYTGYNYYRINLLTEDTLDFEYLFDNFQIEEKSHPTPFTAVTRSATEGLKDLAGSTTIDLTNAGFNSNAEIDLDGTGDYFETTTENQLASDQTLEAVFIKDQDSSPHTTILCTDIAYEHGIKLMAYKNSARYGMWLGFGSGGDVYNAFVNTALPNNEYLHLVGTWEQSTGIVKIYLNGELTGTISTGRTDDIQTRSGGRITIGADYHSLGNPYGIHAQVPIAKIYNRALTAAEVKNNYNHYKNRFGI